MTQSRCLPGHVPAFIGKMKRVGGLNPANAKALRKPIF
jgi:hypothetical protein